MPNQQTKIPVQNISVAQPEILENESIHRVFWRYAIPSIAAMLVNGLYQIIDGIFVGYFVGFTGLAAINMTMPIIGVIIGLGIMIGMGGGSLMSISRGEGNRQKAAAMLGNSLWVIILLSILCLLVIEYLALSLLNLQGAKQATLSLSLDYINIFKWGAISAITAAAVPILIRNDNRPNLATGLMILGAVINILLDYIFIGQYEMALKGAAIATILSQSLVAIIGIGYFLSSSSHIKLSLRSLTLEIRLALKIIVLGSSSLFMFLYFSLIIAVHNRLFMTYGSAIEVGAFAIVGYIATLYYVSSEGIANGMQPPVSFYFGAKQTIKIKKTLLLALKLVIYLGIVVVIILNLFPDLFISLFNNGDIALAKATIRGLRLHLFALFLDGFLFVASVYFMSVNQGAKALSISIANIIIQLPFLYLLPKWWGINGIWLSLPLSNVVLSFIVAPILWKEMKKLHHKEPIAL